jgi:ribosomal protein L20A (L18A)
MKIVILNTGLFPEKGVLEEALAQLGSEHEVSRRDVDAELPDADWDAIVQALVSADRIITL